MSARIPMFGGQNFEFWKLKLVAFFEGKGLERTLRPPDQVDTTWMKADAKARMYILESVDDEHVELIMQQSSARGMVAKLEGMYSASSDACTNGSKKGLRDDFLALKMADDDEPGHFFRTFATYLKALDESGDRLSSKEVLDCLQMSVGKSYRHLLEDVDLRMEPSKVVEEAKKKMVAEYAARANGAMAVDDVKVEPPAQKVESPAEKDVWNASRTDGAKAVDVKVEPPAQMDVSWNASRTNGAKAFNGVKVEPPAQKDVSWNASRTNAAMVVDGVKVEPPAQKMESPAQKDVSWNASRTNGTMAVNGVKVEKPAQKAEPPAQKAERPAHKVEPLAHKAEPPAHKAEPPAHKAERLAHKVEPLAQKAEPLTQKVEPFAQKDDSWKASRANGAKAVKVESPAHKGDSWNAFKRAFKDESEECHRCGHSGHWARQCSQPIECYNCGQEGHWARQCPQPMECYNCGQEGHTKFSCAQKAELCYGCGQEGHRRFECPDRAHQDPTAPVKYFPTSTRPSAGSPNKRMPPKSPMQLPALMDMPVSPPAAVVEEPRPTTEWILDSCATYHSICDESLFSKCVSLEKPVSAEVNGHSLSSSKMGEVRVCFRVGNRFHARVLPQVYLIEEFEQNLLSIQRLVQFGGSVLLKASEVELRDPANQMMARGKKIKNLYVIESYSETCATVDDFDARA